MSDESRKIEAAHLLKQGLEQSQSNQKELALQTLQSALSIYRDCHDYLGEAEALKHLSNLYYNLDNYHEAIEYSCRYLDVAQNLHDSQAQQTALEQLGNAYYCIEDYFNAIEAYEKSLSISQQLQIFEQVQTVLNRLGLCHAALTNYQRAIEYYQQSLALAQNQDDEQSQSWILHDLGEVYAALGQYDKAVDCYQVSLTIAKNLHDYQGQVWTLENLGDVYLEHKNYDKAIESYQKGIELEEEFIELNVSVFFRKGWLLCKIGNIYAIIRNPNRATEFYLKSLLIAQAFKKLELEGQVLGRLGNAYIDMGLYGEAIKHHQDFLNIAQQLGNSKFEVQALANLSSACYFNASYEEAIDYCQRGLILTRQLNDKAEEVNILATLGNIYDDLGQHLQAIEHHQYSLEVVRTLRNEELKGGILNNLGAAFFRAGRFLEAEMILREAIEVWEAIRQSLGEHDLYRVSVFDSQIKTYRHLQQVLVVQGRTNEALEIAEQSRTRALIEIMISRLRPRFGAEAKLTFSTIEQIQEIARMRNATLVEYSVIYHSLIGEGQPKNRGSELLIWVIHPTGKISFRSVDITFLKQQNQSLSQLAEQARESIGVRGRDAVSLGYSYQTKVDLERLKQLYQILIEPIISLLPDEPDTHVVFLPQGALFLVPFAALPDPAGRYLVEKYTISIAPSIQTLGLVYKLSSTVSELEEAEQKNVMREAVVVGNPTMPEIQMQAGELPRQLNSLPGAEQEARAIAPLLNTKAIVGRQATKPAIIRQMVHAPIIHLATHGLLDDFDQTDIPGILALAPSEKDNGLLTAAEILQMSLEAKLVVLSACDTGRGRITGDSVIGLSRSFMVAGVPSLIVSLWAVPDTPTASFMTIFYKNLFENNLSKAQALRQAILATYKQYPDCLKAWAAFTLVGDPQ